MKKILFFLSLLLVLSEVGYAKKYNNQNFIAKVKIIKGKAYIKTDKTKKRKLLKINQKIPVNSDIITLKKSKVILFFKGGLLVELKPNSHLIVNKSFINKNNILLSLINGRSRFKVKKLLKNNKMQVYAPTAVVGVRGTDYEVQIADDGSLGVNVYDGKIKVDSDSGNKIVNKNQSAEVSLEKQNIKIDDAMKDLEKWDKEKKMNLKKNPEKKASIIKTKFANTKKSQLDLLENIDKQKKDKVKTEKSADTFFKNIAASKGLYRAARNLKIANKKNKLVNRLFKSIKRMYNTLEKLNKKIEEKFNKLDEYYNTKSKNLEEKFNKLDNKLQENIDKKFNDDSGDF